MSGLSKTRLSISSPTFQFSKLVSSLEKNTTPLEVLKLQNRCLDNLATRTKNRLLKSLEKNSTLIELGCNDQNLSDDQIIQLLSAIQDQENQTLKRLSVTRNSFSGKCTGALSTLLIQRPDLMTLKLDGNDLGDVGVRFICKTLSDKKLGSQLTYLQIGSNQQTVGSMKSVGKMLALNTSIQRFQIRVPNGMKHIVKGLKKNKTLTNLSLRGSHFDRNEMEIFQEYLSTTTTLHALDLSWCTFDMVYRDQILRLLKKGLCKNTSIVSLNLSKLKWKVADFKSFLHEEETVERINQTIEQIIFREDELNCLTPTIRETMEIYFHAATLSCRWPALLTSNQE